MKKNLHPLKTYTLEDVDRILKDIERASKDIRSLAIFLSKEYTRQNNETLISDTEFNANPVPLYYDNFHWRGNEQSRNSVFQGAVIRHEIFYIESLEMFNTHFDKTIPEGMFVLGKKMMSEAVYLFRRFSAPDVNLLTPMLWHKVLPKHFKNEFDIVLKERSISTRTSLSLELCVKSEERRKILDSIVEDAIWENKKK